MRSSMTGSHRPYRVPPPLRTQSDRAPRARQARLCLALSAGIEALLAAGPAAAQACPGEDEGDGGYVEVAVDDVRYMTRAVEGGYVQVTRQPS